MFFIEESTVSIVKMEAFNM